MLPHLADQALENLVNQFARPLDCLRELVQNAIDAGSSRVDVAVGYERSAELGDVARISVADAGEGMDAAIIEQQLTRMFASTKEGDLSKIGKFGIGFTSIFAIRPALVAVRTGRHGEAWEILFHPDRTWERRPLPPPVHGTRVTLYKPLARAQLAGFVEECRSILSYWCEHSETPVVFTDETAAAAPVDAGAHDDPFAAFAAPMAATQTVNQPLGLDAEPVVRFDDGTTRGAVGVAEPPRYGFYTAGLTLLATSDPETLGSFAPRLGHVAFKLKDERLAHTLTRDNVIQDDAWKRALERVERARAALRDAVLARCAADARTGADLQRWHAWLAADVRAYGPFPTDIACFRDPRARPVTAAALAATRNRVGKHVVGAPGDPLVEAVVDAGIAVAEDGPGTRALLEVIAGEPPIPVAAAYALPEPLADDALPRREAALLARLREVVAGSQGFRVLGVRWAPAADSAVARIELRFGEFGGPDAGARDALVAEGEAGARVFRRVDPTARWLPAVLSWRTLVINRHHPAFRAHLLAADADLALGALGLAQAVLSAEGVEAEAALVRMLEHWLDAEGR